MRSLLLSPTFRLKLLASHVGLAVAVVLLVVLQISRSVGADMRRSLETRAEDQARGAAQWINERRHVDRLAGRLAQVVHADVAIFDRDGRLVGSSDQGEPSGPTPQRVGDEPELVAARAGRAGHDTRAAPHGGGEMHYVAVPAEGGMIVRLAIPLSDIDTTVHDLHRRLAYAFAFAVVAAALLASLAARIIARPLRAMTDAAERIAGGDYDIRPLADSPDELGQLGRSLASLATQLRAKIDDLVAERDRLQAIFAGLVEGVLVLDPGGRVVLANPAAARVLDQGEPLDGRPFADIVSNARLRAVVERGLAERELQEEEIETEGETARATAIYVRPLQAGVVAVVRDMTHIRRLLAQRRDLVANVSHELRTPVTAVQGYAETLLALPGTAAQAREFLEIIHRHALRLGGLVEQLVELSELEVRAPDSTRREPIDVRAIAESVGRTLAKRAEREGVTLAVDVAPGLEVLGDPLGLEHVLENLVDNAIKYGRTRGTVRIVGAHAGDGVRLSVVDDGEGIEARHLPHLFERFYRVDPSRSRERGGAGLGLAIVKHLVESMGGRIAVESRIGEGTTFTVSLRSA